MKQQPLADARDRERLASIAMFADVVGGTHRGDPFRAEGIAVAGGHDAAIDGTGGDLAESHVRAAAQAALTLHADMPQFLAVVEEVVQASGDDARPVANVPRIARTEEPEVRAKVVAIRVREVRQSQIERHPILDALTIRWPDFGLQALVKSQPQDLLFIDEFVVRRRDIRTGSRADGVEPRIELARQDTAERVQNQS